MKVQIVALTMKVDYENIEDDEWTMRSSGSSESDDLLCSTDELLNVSIAHTQAMLIILANESSPTENPDPKASTVRASIQSSYALILKTFKTTQDVDYFHSFSFL